MIGSKGNQKKNLSRVVSWLDYLKVAAIIIVIIATGFIAINQFLNFIYKNQLAVQPCDLCVKLNPEIKECIYPEARASYPDGNGGWTNPFKESSANFTLP